MFSGSVKLNLKTWSAGSRHGRVLSSVAKGIQAPQRMLENSVSFKH